MLKAYHNRTHFACKTNDTVFDAPAFDEFIQYADLREGDIRIVKHGELVAQTAYINNNHPEHLSRRVNKKKVADYLYDGYTIIFERINYGNKYFSQLAEYVNQLFNATSWVNCYLTPKSSAGFDIHTDDHDVVILQLSGSKKWYVYPEGADKVTILLNEYDILYLPQGMKHHAETTSHNSLHATIGFNPNTYYTVLKDILLARLKAYDHIIYKEGDKEQLEEILNAISVLPGNIQLQHPEDDKNYLALMQQLNTVSLVDEHTVLAYNPAVNIVKHPEKLELNLHGEPTWLQLADFEFIKETRMLGSFSLSGTKTAISSEKKLAIIKKLLPAGILERK